MDIITSKVNPMLNKLEGSVNGLVDKLDLIEIDPQVINQKAREVFNPLDRAIDDLRTKLNSINPSELIQNLDLSVNRLVSKIDAINFSPDTLQEKTQEIFLPLDQAIRELKDKLSNLQISPDFLANQITPIINDISALQSNLIAQQEGFANTIDKAFSNLAQHEDSISRFTENSQTILENQEKLEFQNG